MGYVVSKALERQATERIVEEPKAAVRKPAKTSVSKTSIRKTARASDSKTPVRKAAKKVATPARKK
jgi:hypothetical protein